MICNSRKVEIEEIYSGANQRGSKAILHLVEILAAVTDRGRVPTSSKTQTLARMEANIGTVLHIAEAATGIFSRVQGVLHASISQTWLHRSAARRHSCGEGW